LAILTQVSLEEVRAFLEDYVEAPVQGLKPIPAGTVNSSYAVELAGQGPRFLRIYEEQDRGGALGEAQLLAHLADRGVKTPPPLRRRDGELVGVLHGKPAVLFPWCEGTTRCLRGVTAGDAKCVGRALARVHRAGEGATLRAGRFRPEDLFVRLERIAACTDPTLAAEAEVLRVKLHDAVAARDESLPRGLVHGDLFRDNVLWDETGNVQALLDFESASEGPFAFDLMVTVHAWCFRDGFEPDLARGIVEGYEEERPLGEREARGLFAEARIAAIRFTITRITDDALRALKNKVPPRRDKDWRRFAARLAEVERLGEGGLRALVGLS
jgi:homoserine kinase type II